jgi:hypothetical protein
MACRFDTVETLTFACKGDRMEFTEQQRLFLELLCTYFHEIGKWPTFEDIERSLFAQKHFDIDVIDVGRELDAFLHDGAHAPLYEGALSNEVYISLSALHTCQTSGICPPWKRISMSSCRLFPFA